MKLLTIQEGWKDFFKRKPPAQPAAPAAPAYDQPNYLSDLDPNYQEPTEQAPSNQTDNDTQQQNTNLSNKVGIADDFVNPDQLFRQRDHSKSTFIYTQDGQLHLGDWKNTHADLIHRDAKLTHLNGLQRADSARVGLQHHALLGRIGKYQTGPTSAKKIVSFWTTPDKLMPLLKPCLQTLLDRGLIKANAELHHPRVHTTTVGAYLGGQANQRTDNELDKKLELARQLHLMPSDQKRKAMKELGLASHSKPNRWRDEMRKAGIPAGSSHHFGTSEGNMRHFERILNEVLKGWHVGDTEPGKGGFMRGNFGRTKINTADAYKSVKYARTLSDKLSRLTKHDIIILVGNGLQKFVGGPSGRLLKKMDQTHEAALSKMTGIPISDFETSFTVLIIGNQGQPRLSPWLILHQIGECIVQYSGEDFWNDTIFPKYQKYFNKMSPELNISQDTLKRHYSDYNERMWKQYGGVDQYEEEHGQKYRHPYDNPNTSVLAFHNLFKMKSARELIHGEFDNIDPSQEIIVDYLWHGGNIRMNQPEWLDPKVVDAIRRDITTWIDQKLTRLAGYRLVNEPEFVDETDQPGDEFSDHIRDRLG